MNPLLSLNQLSRLRKALVYYQFVENSIQAKKLTAYNYLCRQTVNSFFKQHGVPIGLEDISELYKFTSHVIPQITPEKKAELSNDLSEQTIKKQNSKGRGKGKKPSKIMYPVRFDETQLKQLQDLGGNVSKHIRDAVDQYIEDALKV